MNRSLTCLVLAAAAAIPTQAAITSAASRLALGANDNLNWNSAGPEFVYLGNSFNVNTFDGVTVNVSAGANMERTDQGSSWFGNFGAAEALLWTGFENYGPLTLNPTSLIAGGGAQIQTSGYGAFTALIEAYGPGNTFLGSYSVNGMSTEDEDDSAIFLGLYSDSFDIDKLVFSITAADDLAFADFAIDDVDLITGNQAVPEVQTYAMMLGMGLIGAQALRRRLALRK